ncbi:50S ribosomal protein L37e [Candidatus Hikarchaeum yamanae]|uniref:50S ribosomal protein L37e n=1 Tax=Candidatus Hikarchaeum yamanae TaxID=2675326 RepID=UPI00388B354E
MPDGTSSKGKKNKTIHVKCRRCGVAAYHIKKGVCSSCGFGKSAKMRSYSWQSMAGDR